MTHPTEAQEQATVIEWANTMQRKYPELKWLHHIPNGGSRHPAEAKNLKRQGVKAGVSDLCLPVKRGDYSGLYIEMKSKTGKPSDHQLEFLEFVQGQGFAVAVCYGADEAICLIEKYMEKGNEYGTVKR